MGIVGKVQRGILAALDNGAWRTRRELAESIFGNTERRSLVSTRRALIDLWRAGRIDAEYVLMAGGPTRPRRWQLVARSRRLRPVA